MNSQVFYSRGKLLLSGEYYVLHGATALAIPLNLGQTLQVTPSEKSFISWKTYSKDKLWMKAEFDNQFNIIQSSNMVSAQYIQQLLLKANEISLGFVKNGYCIETGTEFDIEWGMGSSSSLISNIAYWLDIDPFHLLWKISKGSGYDIACARSNKPILFKLHNHKPEWETVDFNPSFSENIVFIYSGRKEPTEKNISYFNKSIKFDDDNIEKISEITISMSKTDDYEYFESLIAEHNEVISGLLKLKIPCKNDFMDFEGQVKPLGAWGGDFFMAVSKSGPEYVKSYFTNKGFKTILGFKDICELERKK